MNAIEKVKQIIHHGGYICWTDDSRPSLYDGDNHYICGVPLATAERIARDPDNTKWVELWGGHYVGRYLNKRYQNHSNNSHCKQIADNIADYVSGLVYRCPECGHEFITDGEKYRCPECGFTGDMWEFENLGLYDYFENCLDIEYRCDSRKEYRSVQLMVACGGPNIYVDTGSERVELYWWGDRADYPLDRDSVAAIDEWAEEYWNM